MPSYTHAPFPLLEVAVEPRSRGDADELHTVLSRLEEKDPQLSIRTDPVSGVLLLGGLSEAQLEARIDDLVWIHGVRCDVGAPSIVYRETLGRRATVDAVHRRMLADGGEFARVVVQFEPVDPGSGFVFENAAQELMPAEFVPAIARGLKAAAQAGLLAGFPLTDVKATLVDGAWHDQDSSPLAFELAARAAVRDLRDKGAPRLLEPVMTVEAITSQPFADAVVSDLERREARVQAVESRDELRVVRALAPLAKLFGYEEALRDLARGRARCVLSFAGYAPSPFSDGSPGPFAPVEAMPA